MISKHPQTTIDMILDLDKNGNSHRKIAELVLGSESKKSTVSAILLKAKMKLPEIPTYVKLKPKSYDTEDNSRILIISDIHIPYHHPQAVDFLEYLKNKYNPTRVICMGDEADKHSLSYHESNPDLPSAGDELRKCLPVIERLHKLFPKMTLLESNHGSLVYRKAKTHGIPVHYLKSYNDVLGVDSGWKWVFDLTLTLPNGQQCYFHHGKTTDVAKLSQQMGMSAVQGHYHNSFKIDYWGNPNGLFWGMQTGCLVDDSALAFSYNNVNIKRPCIGTGLIINSLPVLEPMILDKTGQWIY